MDSKPPPVQAAKPLRRKVHVVYYLSRGEGQMDHPHLLEGYLSAAQDGLRLRDFKRWLSVLRGKSMPSTFAWSYKRTYKNGFIWHDLAENDLIQPLSKNEYVLMGSEIKEHGVLGNCKCGAVQRQIEGKVTSDVGDIHEEPLNKSVLRSPKLVTKSSLSNAEDDQKMDGVTQIRSQSGRLPTAENIAHDNRISKSGMQYRGGSSRSFSELTAQRLLEEVKRPSNYQETNKHSANKSFNQSRGINARALIRDSELGTEDQEEIVEANSNDEVQGELHEARTDIKKGNCANSGPYIKQATSTPKSRRDYNKDVNHEDIIGVLMSDGHDNDDDANSAYIMDAATQTGDSTRCSTDHQDSATPISARYNNMLELMGSPGTSAKYSGAYINSVDADAIRRVSSARFNKNHHAGSGVVRGNLSKQLSKELSDVEKAMIVNHHAGSGVVRGNLSKQLSKEFSDVEKAMMVNQTSELGDDSKAANVSSSNNTSLLNHMGSPALSACSAMSSRSTRFARKDNNPPSYAAAAKSSSKKNISKTDSHHTHHKGSHSGSTSTTSSAPHTLLKQLLTCGNADVITESKPSDRVVIMSTNALTGLQTPSRMISTSANQGGPITSHDKKGSNSNNNMWACRPGLIRRMSTASSDNKSVVSGTISDQASIRDTSEMISSPESVYNNRHLKSHIIKANSLTASQLRSSRVDAAPGAAAAGSTSPGMYSVGSSTSRRSSMRENADMNMVAGGNVEEGFREALRSHHVGMGVSPKTRPNKGNKNPIPIHDILGNEASHECRIETNSTTRGAKANSTTVRELHKLICNPGGTPLCSNNHNKVISSNFANLPLECHVHNTSRGNYTPHHQSHHILIATHGPSRTPTRSSNLNSPNQLVVLSKSLNSPSTSMFLEEISQPPPSSSYLSSWKDLLWSPRYNSSHKEKEKRHMKP